MRLFNLTQFVRSLMWAGIISTPLTALAQDAEFNSQHGLKLIKADEAYAQGFTGKGVMVGLVDSGIDSDHTEFYGRLLSGFDLTTGKVILPRSGNTDLPDYDEHGQIEDEGGHGTHVAGTIAANKDGKGMHGVAYDSQIFMVKPFNEIEKLGKAFIVAAQYRPKIINLSLGLNNCDADGEGGEFCNISDYTQQDVLNNQIESSALEGLRALHEKGILVVAATGNESQPSSDVLAGMPYLFNELKENSLAVTAVNQFRELADYSNKCGVAAEWCLSAPGGDEIEEKDYIEWINSTLPGGGYGNPEMMGTSMATPHVVGVAALVAEAFPYFSANNLQQTILTTATPLGDRNVYGWGLVNAGKAVKGPAQFIDVFHADTQGVDSVFLNDISGDGVLFKTGQGRLELPGQNTFSLVFAEKGELAITGTHANRVFADRNARLSGDGQIGDVVVAGVIAPGVAEKNPFGQLTILDSFVAQAEAVLEITTSIDGQSSGLHLNGVSQIDNMHIALKGDAFRPGVYYTVLDGNSDILGGASQLTGAKTTFLEGVIDQKLQQLQVKIVRNDMSLSQFTLTANQKSVAQGLDKSSHSAVIGLQPLYDSILNSDGSSLSLLTQQLGAEVYSSAKSALIQSDWRWAQQLLRQARQLQVEDTPVWAEISTSYQQLGAKNGASTAKFNQTGVALGGQWRLNSRWALGAALAYQDGKLTLHDRDEQAKTNSYSTALYVRNHIPLISNASHLNWLTGISLGHHRLDYKRNLVALDHQRLSSNAKTNSYQLFTELGWLLPMNDQWSVEPFVGAAWLHSRFGAMSEDGGYAALGYGANTLNTGYTQLGIRNAYGWDLANGQKGAVYLDLAWQHSFGKQQPHSSLQFASNQSVSFTTHGASLNKNSMQFGFGASVAVNTMSDVSLAYQGVLAGSSRRQHGGMLTIQHRF